jgi:hypothetical protein
VILFTVTLPPPHCPTLLNISMIHPCCATDVAAASQTRGAATALRDRDKYQAYAAQLHPGHTFVPASVETHGHVGKPIMRYRRTLSDVASACSPAVTRDRSLQRIASAHRELTVALVQSQGYVYRSCALLLAKSPGRPVLPGADTPYFDGAICFVCWLPLDFVPRSAVLGALGSLRLLPSLQFILFAIRALVDCNASLRPALGLPQNMKKAIHQTNQIDNWATTAVPKQGQHEIQYSHTASCSTAILAPCDQNSRMITMLLFIQTQHCTNTHEHAHRGNKIFATLPGLHHSGTAAYCWGVHLCGTPLVLRPAFPFQLQSFPA